MVDVYIDIDIEHMKIVNGKGNQKYILTRSVLFLHYYDKLLYFIVNFLCAKHKVQLVQLKV